LNKSEFSLYCGSIFQHKNILFKSSMKADGIKQMIKSRQHVRFFYASKPKDRTISLFKSLQIEILVFWFNLVSLYKMLVKNGSEKGMWFSVEATKKIYCSWSDQWKMVIKHNTGHDLQQKRSKKKKQKKFYKIFFQNFFPFFSLLISHFQLIFL